MILSSLLLLAAPAAQGPIEITFRGTVATTPNTLVSGPLVNALPGESVTVTYRVETPGNIGGSSTFDIFNVVPGSPLVTVGTVVLAGGTNSTGLFLFNHAPGGFGDITTTSLSFPGGLNLGMLVKDPSSTVWSSVDIAANTGLYPESLFDVVEFEFYDVLDTLNVDLVSVEIAVPSNQIGTYFCSPGIPNSTGASAEIKANGSILASNNDVALSTTGMPPNTFGIFLVGSMTASPTTPANSSGRFCIGGSLGRYNQPGQVLTSGSAGEFNLTLDLTQTPQPMGPIAITAGQTWHFQAWHRDPVGIGSGPTSNFSDGVYIDFQ